MSKPCQGSLVTPIKGAALVKPVDATPIKKYMAPSKRAEIKKEVRSPTSEELSSESSFPSLPAMTPTTSGATWLQLRSRLTSPKVSPTNQFAALDIAEDTPTKPEMKFKEIMEARIEREREEQQEGIRRDNTTDPKEMTIPQREAHGWKTLIAHPRSQQLCESYNSHNAVDFTDMASWTTPCIPQEAMNDPRKFLSHIRCVNQDGSPLQRIEVTEPDYFALHETKDEPTVIYTPISQKSEKNARKNLLSFISKRQISAE